MVWPDSKQQYVLGESVQKASCHNISSSSAAADFDISLDKVNWLGNIVALVYLPGALLVPLIVSRYGIHRVVGPLPSVLTIPPTTIYSVN